MKNSRLLYLSFVFLFFIPYFSKAQVIEWSDNLNFKDQTNLATTSSRGEFVIAGHHPDFYLAPPGFFVLDSLGKLLTKQFIAGAGFEIGFVTDMTQTENGDFYILGVGGLCDVCCWGSVQKYNAGWNPFWDYSTIPQTLGTVQKISVAEEGLIFLLREDAKIELIAPDGNFLELFDLPNQNYFDLLAYPNDTLIIAGQGLTFMNWAGAILGSVLENHLFSRLEKLPGNLILAQNDHNLFIINDTFDLIHTLNFEDEKISDIAFNHQYISVLFLEDTLPKLLSFDYELKLINQFSIYLPGLEVKAIALGNDKVVAAGTEKSENQSVFAKSFTLEGNTFDFGMDAGITSIQFGTMPYVAEVNEDGIEQIHMENIEITVKNYGNNPIDSLRINADFGIVSFICDFPQTFFKNYYDLQLNPGNSVVLQINEIYFLTTEFENPFEFCFWTSIPNNKTDQDHANDKYCDLFLITDVEEVLSESSLKIYPNPSADFIRLEFEKPPSDKVFIKIYNYLGQRMEGNYYSYEHENKWDISHLPKGTYFIQLQNNDQIFAWKFIKM